MIESKDAVSALAAIVGAVAAGELTPAEAAELSKVVDGYTRALWQPNWGEYARAFEGAYFARQLSRRGKNAGFVVLRLIPYCR